MNKKEKEVTTDLIHCLQAQQDMMSRDRSKYSNGNIHMMQAHKCALEIEKYQHCSVKIKAALDALLAGEDEKAQEYVDHLQSMLGMRAPAAVPASEEETAK